MKIKAAVLRESGLPKPYRNSRPLKIETIDLDKPEKGEVLIEIKAAGLCHSDLVAIDGERPKPMPIVLGHEAVGTVAECGPGVTAFEVGDTVVPSFVASCGHCEMCRAGRPALCQPASLANAAGTLIGGHCRLHQDGQSIFHHSGVSAFAEFAVLSEYSLVKISDDIPAKHAALFGCGVMTGVGAILNTSDIKVGDMQVMEMVGVFLPIKTRSTELLDFQVLAVSKQEVEHAKMISPWTDLLVLLKQWKSSTNRASGMLQ